MENTTKTVVEQVATTTDAGRNTATTLLRYVDVEREYGLNRNTLYALVHQGRIPHIRFGPRFVRFLRADLERWVSSNAVVGGAR